MSIVLTGAGAVSGYGQGLRALHDGLLSGTRSFVPWPLLESVRAPAWPVCRVPDVSGPGSRSAQLALAASLEALGDLRDERLGIIVGGTTGGMLGTEACFLDGTPPRGVVGIDARLASEHPVSEIAEVLARELGANGPRTTIVSACSSGLNAVILAQRWVEHGMCDRVLAVGTDALCRLTVMGFASLGAIDPEGARPFQTARKGITIGEAAAAFVVEKEKKARPVLARLLGASMIGEAFHATQPDPSGAGAARAMRNALKGVQRVDAVSAHGTATPQNDAMETRAIAETLGERVPVSSQKSQLGHTLGAAGAIELAACLNMLQHQVMYPTYGLTPESLDPACAVVSHVFAPREMKLETIVKNSFAFGGQNSVLVVGRA